MIKTESRELKAFSVDLEKANRLLDQAINAHDKANYKKQEKLLLETLKIARRHLEKQLGW